jgi:hypothetical protein
MDKRPEEILSEEAIRKASQQTGYAHGVGASGEHRGMLPPHQ